MQYLAIGRYIADPDVAGRAERGRVAEMRYAWDQYLDDTLRMAWLRTDGQAPVLLIEAPLRDIATQRLTESPSLPAPALDAAADVALVRMRRHRINRGMERGTHRLFDVIHRSITSRNWARA